MEKASITILLRSLKDNTSNSMSTHLTAPLVFLALAVGALGTASTPIITEDVCDLNLIYNESYQYSLPKKILESYLSGKAFDNPTVYTCEESQRLHNDINELYQQILSQNPPKEPMAIITAGAPGAGKTVLIRQIIEINKLKDKNSAYISPDDVCLVSQTRTYQADINSSDQSMAARLNAYNKWRPASNASTHLILANLIREKYAFYFGITATAPQTGIFFDFLKKQGYKIKLIHVSASDDVRWGSIKERDQTFVQTTEQDVKEKGLLLPQRINDTFLKFADEIEFYFRPGVKQDAVLAARWLRAEASSPHLGTLQIIVPEQYEQIKTIHNDVSKALTRPDLYWESTVEKSSKILP